MPKKQIGEKDSDQLVSECIYVLRGKRVMLDRDLARLYGIETRVLNQAVRRNLERFPQDFMFELDNEDIAILRSQSVISSWGGARYKPMAFSELGIAMLSSVLNSRRAISVNIQIMRVFVQRRDLLRSHYELLNKLEELEKKDLEQDQKLILIFKYLKSLMQAKEEEKIHKHREPIGFKIKRK